MMRTLMLIAVMMSAVAAPAASANDVSCVIGKFILPVGAENFGDATSAPRIVQELPSDQKERIRARGCDQVSRNGREITMLFPRFEVENGEIPQRVAILTRNDRFCFRYVDTLYPAVDFEVKISKAYRTKNTDPGECGME